MEPPCSSKQPSERDSSDRVNVTVYVSLLSSARRVMIKIPRIYRDGDLFHGKTNWSGMLTRGNLGFPRRIREAGRFFNPGYKILRVSDRSQTSREDSKSVRSRTQLVGFYNNQRYHVRIPASRMHNNIVFSSFSFYTLLRLSFLARNPGSGLSAFKSRCFTGHTPGPRNVLRVVFYPTKKKNCLVQRIQK